MTTEEETSGVAPAVCLTCGEELTACCVKSCLTPDDRLRVVRIAVRKDGRRVEHDVAFCHQHGKGRRAA